MDLFYAKQDFFLLKELEKIAPKEKGPSAIVHLFLGQSLMHSFPYLGIVAQSVKDVVQSLVDDNLVDTDKIGTSVYFWAFPSKATAHRQAKLARVKAKNEELAQAIQRQTQLLESDGQGREDTPERQRVRNGLGIGRGKNRGSRMSSD